MARIEVPMPQMGESIAEGTVSKWLKGVGDAVQRDEPILEISTDKVDAEIPAPTSGTLVEITVHEGETVEVGTVLAYIDTERDSGGVGVAAERQDGGGAEPPESAGPAEKGEEAEPAGAQAPPVAAPEPVPVAERVAPPGVVPPPPVLPSARSAAARPGGGADAGGAGEATGAGEGAADARERLRTRSTPVVRRIAEEHGIEIGRVQGTGYLGRVTKQDILSFIGGGAPAEAPPQAPAEGAAPAPPPVGPLPAARAGPAAPRPGSPPATPERAPATGSPDFWGTFYGEVEHPEYPVRAADRVEPMDKIRRLTAEHMVLAKRVAPHVHSFIEIDFSAIDRIRAESRERWSAQGARVSYTAFVVWAASRVLRDFPAVNSAVSGDNVIYRGNVNVGVAVDLDPGLIVPVVHDADHLGLVGIGNKIVDLATRARARKLVPSEIQGATFTITNPGVLGTLVGMPVIPKGTSAILGTGAIEKRVVVVSDPATGTDSTAIRKRAFFSLGYDHRIVDGADAARFLARLKETLESFPADA